MTRPIKVGIQLPEVERIVRWPELAEMARTAEEIGLDSIWVGDHLLYRDRDVDPTMSGGPPARCGGGSNGRSSTVAYAPR